MIHEEYTGKIRSYVEGIEHDLESVIPKEGHDLVKDSITEQAKRLADFATHNNKFLIEMMDEFFTMLENRHNVVDFREYDCWNRSEAEPLDLSLRQSRRWDVIPHKQLMKEFEIYLKWGLDAVDHFDDKEEKRDVDYD